MSTFFAILVVVGSLVAVLRIAVVDPTGPEPDQFEEAQRATATPLVRRGLSLPAEPAGLAGWLPSAARGRSLVKLVLLVGLLAAIAALGVRSLVILADRMVG